MKASHSSNAPFPYFLVKKQDYPQFVYILTDDHHCFTKSQSRKQIMATPNNDEMPRAPSVPADSTLREFHLFPKLPTELKDMIFKHALFPQLIKVDMEPGMVWSNADEHCSRTVMPTSANGRPLLSACRHSRAIALEHYGDDYVFVNRCAELDISTARMSPPTRFRPQSDTLYFADMMPFCHLGWDGAFGLASRGISSIARQVCQYGGLNDIRSVVIGGLMERAFLRDDVIFMTPRECSGASNIADQLASLPNLEEVIVVSPTIQQLCDRASKIKNEWDLGIVLSEDVLKTLNNVTRVKERLQRAMNLMGCMLHDTERHWPERPAGPQFRLSKTYGRPIAVSDWWKNPIVTWLTESELKARFDLGKFISDPLRKTR